MRRIASSARMPLLSLPLHARPYIGAVRDKVRRLPSAGMERAAGIDERQIAQTVGATPARAINSDSAIGMKRAVSYIPDWAQPATTRINPRNRAAVFIRRLFPFSEREPESAPGRTPPRSQVGHTRKLAVRLIQAPRLPLPHTYPSGERFPKGPHRSPSQMRGRLLGAVSD